MTPERLVRGAGCSGRVSGLVDFALLVQRALNARGLYEEHEHRTYGREWTTQELTLGLAGDVGDLAKLIQAQAGVRSIDDLDAKLGHELADILWPVIVIAEKCGVDLASAFESTMDEIEAALTAAQ